MDTHPRQSAGSPMVLHMYLNHQLPQQPSYSPPQTPPPRTIPLITISAPTPEKVRFPPRMPPLMQPPSPSRKRQLEPPSQDLLHPRYVPKRPDGPRGRTGYNGPSVPVVSPPKESTALAYGQVAPPERAVKSLEYFLARVPEQYHEHARDGSHASTIAEIDSCSVQTESSEGDELEHDHAQGWINCIRCLYLQCGML